MEMPLTVEEFRKLEMGRNAWDESLFFFHHPAIPDPNFLFDRTKHLGYFIQPDTWITTMNLSNSPSLILDKEIFTYFHALALHEISHYIVCPYDMITNAKLIRAAMKHVPDRLSMVVTNFFADLIVDTKLYQKKPKVMEFEFFETQRMAKQAVKDEKNSQHSKFFKVMSKCYELLWDTDLHLDPKEYAEIEPLAKKIAKIIQKDIEDFTTWEKKVAKIAKILKEILEDEFSPNFNRDQENQLDSNNSCDFESSSGNSSGDNSNQDSEDNENDPNGNSEGDAAGNSEGNSMKDAEGKNRGNSRIQKPDKSRSNLTAGGLSQLPGEPNVPKDVQVAMGNPLEIKAKAQSTDSEDESDKTQKKKANKADEKDAETLAQGMSLKDFTRLNRIIKLVDEKDQKRMYYRGISKNLLSIKIVDERPSGSLPVGIEPWRLGDSIEKLDVLQSALISPKLIPNITTRKWVYKEGPGIEMNIGMPDLMLVVDSSGSMDWDWDATDKKNKSAYHLALVASFASLQYAISKGVKVSAINFSESFRVQSWTKEYRKVEDILLKYMGNGTTLPIKKMKKLCEKGERNSLIILITDFEIYNWEYAFNIIVDILAMGNKIVGFFIDGDSNELESEDFKKLRGLGAKFYPVKKIEDLLGMVIKEVKDTYEH